MTNPDPEDEAFEELALKQGHWQHTSGWRKKQIQEPNITDKEAMAMALDALETLMIERGSIYEKAIAALKAALAQPEQEPVAWLDPWTRNNVTTDYDAYGNNGIPLYTAPPQRTEQNFCPRCGKRTKDIHTCTPPKENT